MYVVTLGYPGSGKTTFGQAIESNEMMQCPLGNIVRKKMEQDPEFKAKYAHNIQNHIVTQELWDLVEGIVAERLEQAVSMGKGLILDGYPKSVAQCKYIDDFLEAKGLKDRLRIVYFKVKKKVAIERISSREICEKCNKIYHLQNQSRNCQVEGCDGKLVRRFDDDQTVAQKRVYEYKETIKEVFDYYQSSNRLIILNANDTPESCVKLFHQTIQAGIA